MLHDWTLVLRQHSPLSQESLLTILRDLISLFCFPLCPHSIYKICHLWAGNYQHSAPRARVSVCCVLMSIVLPFSNPHSACEISGLSIPCSTSCNTYTYCLLPPGDQLCWERWGRWWWRRRRRQGWIHQRTGPQHPIQHPNHILEMMLMLDQANTDHNITYLLLCLEIPELGGILDLLCGPSVVPFPLEVNQEDWHCQLACSHCCQVLRHSLTEELMLISIVVEDKWGLEPIRCHRSWSLQEELYYLNHFQFVFY